MRHKLFSIINIFGLAIGLAAVMLIALYVRYETSYDSFWKNADNIYRTEATYNFPGRGPLKTVLSVGAMKGLLKKDFPQIKNTARINLFHVTFTQGENVSSDEVYQVDPEILKIFDFKVIDGDINNALNTINGFVITKSRAEKLFGETNPIGQSLSLDFKIFKRDYIIKALIEDIPENSQINTSAMVALNDADWSRVPNFNSWLQPNHHLYYTLHDNADNQDVINGFPSFVERNFVLQTDRQEMIKTELMQITSMNIKELHLYSEGIGNYRPFGELESIKLYSWVGLSLLFIATINYINLSTARAGQRAKEVSLRKISGADRKNLIFQFIGESILVSFVSFVIAVAIIEIVFPFYENYTNIQSGFDYLSFEFFTVIVLAITIGAVGGIYPAVVLSSFAPATILKSNKSTDVPIISRTRKTLVVFQFIISISLFVATAVIYNQFNYINNFELGYNKDKLLYLDNAGREAAIYQTPALISELKQSPIIDNVTVSPMRIGLNQRGIVNFRTTEMAENEAVSMLGMPVGFDFATTMEIPIIAGRDYNETRDISSPVDVIHNPRGNTTTTQPIIINEAAVMSLGFDTPADALGQIIYRKSSENSITNQSLEIIGIIKNIHLYNLKEKAEAMAFLLNNEMFSVIYVRYNSDENQALELMQSLWEKHIPAIEFKPVFIQDALLKQYLKEQNQMTMFATFSGLAIFIACLGLFGLASFTAERRTKEIGIRKVFGAEVFQIVKLLVWQFSKPVLIANVIAWPLSFYAMSRWLETFVYRIDNVLIIAFCLVAGLAALLIAWVTVASNSYAVASQNPINALRYE